MLIKERITVNGKAYDRHYSDNAEHPIIRCGKNRYYEAVDPAGIERTYFEETPSETPEEEANDD